MDLKRIKKVDKSLVLDALYLMEWKYVVMYKKTLTNYTWFYDNRGPNIEYNKKALEKELEFLHVPEDLFECIIEKVERLKYTGIKNLVFSTYPMIATEKYDILYLEELAKEYKSFLSKKELKEVLSLNKKNKISKIKEFLCKLKNKIMK